MRRSPRPKPKCSRSFIIIHKQKEQWGLVALVDISVLGEVPVQNEIEFIYYGKSSCHTTNTTHTIEYVDSLRKTDSVALRKANSRQ